MDGYFSLCLLFWSRMGDLSIEPDKRSDMVLAMRKKGRLPPLIGAIGTFGSTPSLGVKNCLS
jgi:hypothetical protein